MRQLARVAVPEERGGAIYGRVIGGLAPSARWGDAENGRWRPATSGHARHRCSL